METKQKLMPLANLYKVLPKCHFYTILHGLNRNISFAFHAIQKRLAYLMNLCYGVF